MYGLADIAGGGRAPYGARGLKYEPADIGQAERGRAPYGARGLKCVFLLDYCGALCYY